MEDQRFPISVCLIGVMHKGKKKMYMTSVLWSDQNDIVVYRSFRDFKLMHKQMKKAFPSTSKLRKSDRIIPKFPNRRKRGSRKKVPTKSLVRLKYLQKYCNELLSCDPRVAQSADLIKFFHPKDQDLQPEFSKDSIMIMPSDTTSGNAGHSNGGTVTQPFVTETYRCVAPYETKDTKNKPFKVVMDEKVDVLIKDKAGWWLVESEDKRMAWFPAPYLEKADDDDDDGEGDYVDGTPERGMLYTAIKSFKATKDDEITVNIGTVVEVLQQSENGWWLIRYNGKVGYIPTMYLQPYNYPHIRMTAQYQHNGASSPSSLLTPQSQQLSRSQGNLLLPPASPTSSNMLQPGMQRSHSLNVLSENPPLSTSSSAARADTKPPAKKNAPPPMIKVEMDGEEQEQEPERNSPTDDESFLSDSDFSLSDDLSSSSASSFVNLSVGGNDERLRLSHTPPPMGGNRLSPTTGTEGKMLPSVSDPNLYKGPTTPKVPPRPQAQDILTRCTTITRKNAARGSPSPTPTAILSR